MPSITETNQFILSKLPYTAPFLFVDEISEVSENHIVGHYTFKKEEYFYKGHFINNPVTPGVILLETMGQIGLVCFGIFLLYNQENKDFKYQTFLTSLDKTDFFKQVLPNTKVIVKSEKIYYRKNLLNTNIKMFDEQKNLVANTNASCIINLL